jgi:hypothetical protein
MLSAQAILIRQEAGVPTKHDAIEFWSYFNRWVTVITVYSTTHTVNTSNPW